MGRKLNFYLINFIVIVVIGNCIFSCNYKLKLFLGNHAGFLDSLNGFLDSLVLGGVYMEEGQPSW